MPFIINEFARPAALPSSKKFEISFQPAAKTLVSGKYSIIDIRDAYGKVLII